MTHSIKLLQRIIITALTVCALLGLECHVYMGSVDMARQQPNVFRMRLLGAEVCPVDSGSKTLSSDRLIPQPEAGHGYIIEYPDAIIRHLSEEHAQVQFTPGSRRPELGEQVTIIPNHICPCVNLQDQMWWRESDGSIQPIQVDARGELS